MDGAIFFATKYGSTAQYAEWISAATGLPAFDVKTSKVDPLGYDFLVLGSAVIYEHKQHSLKHSAATWYSLFRYTHKSGEAQRNQTNRP